MAKFNIIAPWGGFSNYVRWVILLDDQFSNIYKIKVNEESYTRLAGSSWPNYSDFLIDQFDNIPQHTIDEIKLKAITTINFEKLEEKINFIENYVFSEDRTYHNWLVYEWRYRNLFNQDIVIKHEYEETNLDSLVMIVDPYLCYKCYVKFNISLNGISKDEFIHNCSQFNSMNTMIATTNQTIKLLDSSILYNPILSYDWYQRLISIFNLDDNYHSASKIHKLWYLAQKRAEHDIITDLVSLYN